jgi:hypothetical protein
MRDNIQYMVIMLRVLYKNAGQAIILAVILVTMAMP